MTDPVKLARAGAALDAALAQIKSSIPQAHTERERTRLAYIVASFATLAEDLARRALERFRQSP
ncbi:MULTISPECIES: hypothetical protein [unclassified Bosea (in: a-proteobacteria)]|uniref:hypothetical protein n=1 Tax=unclassified Bosea (in: a-proteobacteria) TaxID=2653178 RepID=UPI000F7E55A5|nr:MULTISPECIES: hypothetical protein [unclassified Bosea (in: a-proteobacteria)]